MNQNRLIVFEGISGAGKSTLIDLLIKKNPDYVLMNWFSEESVKEYAKGIHQFVDASPELYSTIYATDFLVKQTYLMEPLLNRKKTILAHRYIYSQLVRDIVCGTSRAYLNYCYMQHIEPATVFYLDLEPNIALERINNYRIPSFYECGFDLVYRRNLDKGWQCYHDMNDENISKYFIDFQKKVRSEYENIFKAMDENKVKILDASLPLEKLYDIVSDKIQQI